MTTGVEPDPAPEAGPTPAARRLRVRVEGIVQGVGFRPFVHRLAARSGVAGWVGNDARGVVIEAEAAPARLDAFVAALAGEAPPLAVVEAVHTEPLPPRGDTGFAIDQSDAEGERRALVAPDTATCAACLAEVADPADRRHAYAFTNCTNCGPRLTIVTGVPYDRPNTTMAAFAMCEACAAEYHHPGDRRFHAQPVCCPACGPTLSLLDAAGRPTGDTGAEAVWAAAALLAAGSVVAVKGLGGYHLAADAGGEAVATLRARKHREEKPFALMVEDVPAARRLAEVGPAEEALLASPERPVVLLRRRRDAPVAAAVAPGNRRLGVLLPYTPLHHLLLGAAGRPLVMTSGNVSDEPIAFEDADAVARLAGIADAFLSHDRPIRTRVDDSVARVLDGAPVLLRRSRGYVPRPVTLADECRRPVLACGAELKNTFCLARGRHAFVSHHVGDLENWETFKSFADGVAHLSRLLDVAPGVVAHDLHPDYLSTKYALELDEVAITGVQHHHAHVAACLAEHGERGPVIGLALDGLGYGTDGTIWGGELLVADLAGFERAGHLATVPMPGAAAAIREPWRMAAAHLDAAYGGDAPPVAVRDRAGERWEPVVGMARRGVNAPATSSVGRLFDAVAALCGVCDTVTYEGQAAIGLEQLVADDADQNEAGAYPAGVEERDGLLVLRGADLVRSVVDDLRARVPVPAVAARFHRGLAAGVVELCRRERERSGLSTVALSGGVFQNVVLSRAVRAGLEASGFRVLSHRLVPPNDGGLSLGQAAVAAERDRRHLLHP